MSEPLLKRSSWDERAFARTSGLGRVSLDVGVRAGMNEVHRECQREAFSVSDYSACGTRTVSSAGRMLTFMREAVMRSPSAWMG